MFSREWHALSALLRYPHVQPKLWGVFSTCSWKLHVIDLKALKINIYCLFYLINPEPLLRHYIHAWSLQQEGIVMPYRHSRLKIEIDWQDFERRSLIWSRSLDTSSQLPCLAAKQKYFTQSKFPVYRGSSPRKFWHHLLASRVLATRTQTSFCYCLSLKIVLTIFGSICAFNANSSTRP